MNSTINHCKHEKRDSTNFSAKSVRVFLPSPNIRAASALWPPRVALASHRRYTPGLDLPP